MPPPETLPVTGRPVQPAGIAAPGPPITGRAEPEPPLVPSGSAHQTPRSCRLAVASRYELLRFDAGKPVVELSLNGRQLRMQVDSGAETSALTATGAAILGLAPGPEARRQVSGLGGDGGYGVVRVERIGFGSAMVRGLDVPVLPLSGADGLAGLIGGDLLAGYQVSFDFPARRMSLYRAYGCDHVQPPFAATALRFADARALPVVWATLDGRWLRALIDTGASGSAVDTTRAGLTAADLRGDQPSLSYGAGNLSLGGHLHRFGSLLAGGLTVQGATLRAVTLDPSLGIDAIIGMDLLAGRLVWLDYGGRQVFIGGEAAPSG